jgi:translation initiation factor IF-1
MALIDGLVALGSIESPLAGMAGDLAMIGLVANELDGMVIMQSTGSSSTVMMASENIIKGKTEGSMDVNVKLFWDDKVDVKSQVHVYLDSEEITHKVATRLDEGG